MDLPQYADLRMKESVHGSGMKGGYFYRYEDEGGSGVVFTASRKDRRSVEVSAWSYIWMPGQEFSAYAALVDAVLPLTEVNIEAEKARYPYVRDNEPEGDRFSNSCRLCRPRRPAVNQLHLAINPDPMDDWLFSLCADHLPLAHDPQRLLAELKAEVAERKARAAANIAALHAPAEPDDIAF